MDWLCVPNSESAPCPDFVSGVGSFIIILLLMCLAVWLLFIIGRLIWIAHTYDPWRWQNRAHRDVERLLEVHLEHGHGGAKLYEDLAPNTVDKDARNVGEVTSRRLDGAITRIAQLERDVKTLGDPDAVECEAVPCTRGKSGRWLKAWVPFWPRG